MKASEKSNIGNANEAVDDAKRVLKDKSFLGLVRWGRFTAAMGGFAGFEWLEKKTSVPVGSRRKNVPKPRYIYTCKAGLIDLRHFHQLAYIALLRGSKTAVEKGVEHEKHAEASSRYAPEDITSNALGAHFGSQQSIFTKTSTYAGNLKDFLDKLDPIDWNSLSEAKKDCIVKYYAVDMDGDSHRKQLAETRASIMPAGTTNFEDVIGTGGYQLVNYEPGVRTFAKRNPNYFKDNRAHFDEIEIIIIPDVNARTQALKTGQVDVINRPDRKTAHLLDRMPNMQLINVPGGLLYTFPMLTDTAPYDNNDVRMALKYSVDRKELLAKILRGYGVLGNDHPIAPIVKFSAKDLPQRSYDPDKARFHLKKAGLEGHTFKLHTSDAAFAGAVDAAILWQNHAKKAGIDIKVVREPVDGYWDNVWNKKSWSACFWFARVTCDWMFTMAYAAEASANDMHWKHERFNKLLVEARGELNQNRRKGLYGEMQRIVSDEGGVVIPMIANMVDAANNKVAYDEPAGNQELDGLRICERWWFA